MFVLKINGSYTWRLSGWYPVLWCVYRLLLCGLWTPDQTVCLQLSHNDVIKHKATIAWSDDHQDVMIDYDL